MICTFKEGDRVVILDNGVHGTVIKVRVDDNRVPLVDVVLDDARGEAVLGYDVWVARTFELREEGENGE